MSSEEPAFQDGSGGPSVPPDTLDFLFEYTREAPQRQLVAMNALDTLRPSHSSRPVRWLLVSLGWEFGEGKTYPLVLESCSWQPLLPSSWAHSRCWTA